MAARRALGLGLVALLLAAPAAGQADTTEALAPARTARAPVPAEGEVFLRVGPPHLRVRTARPDAAPPDVARIVREEVAALGLGAGTPATDGVTRLDLLRLERAIRRDLDRRFERLTGLLAVGGARPGGFVEPAPSAPPVVVQVPGTPGAVVIPRREAAGTAGVGLGFADLAPDATMEGPAGPPGAVVTAVEVERSLLELGLFRALGVNFEFGRDRLMGSSRAILDRVGEVMTRHPALRLAVQGHTDSVGGAAFNQRLSERRAEAVRAYLLDAFPEIGPERLTAEGFGLAFPIASNDNPTGRALNRRVEFVVLEAPAVIREVAAEPAPEPEEETLGEQLRRIVREEVERVRATAEAGEP